MEGVLDQQILSVLPPLPSRNSGQRILEDLRQWRFRDPSVEAIVLEALAQIRVKIALNRVAL